jgi:hypothetical protein
MGRIPIVMALLLLAPAAEARWGFRSLSRNKPTRLTPAQQFVNKRTGKTRAGDSTRRGLWSRARLRFKLWRKKRSTPGIGSNVQRPRRRNSYLWHKRQRQRQVATGSNRAYRQAVHQHRRQLAQQRKGQGWIKRFKSWRMDRFLNTYRFSDRYRGWAAQYGFKVADKMVMLWLQRQKEQQEQMAKTVARRRSMWHARRRTRERRGSTQTQLSELRRQEGPRFRIFTGRHRGRGLRSLWSRAKQMLRKNQAPRQQARYQTQPPGRPLVPVLN